MDTFCGFLGYIMKKWCFVWNKLIRASHPRTLRVIVWARPPRAKRSGSPIVASRHCEERCKSQIRRSQSRWRDYQAIRRNISAGFVYENAYSLGSIPVSLQPHPWIASSCLLAMTQSGCPARSDADATPWKGDPTPPRCFSGGFHIITKKERRPIRVAFRFDVS